jgi:chaperone BCS1
VKPLLVSRQQSQNVGSENSSRPREIISITTIGRSKNKIVEVFEKIKETRQQLNALRVHTCTEWGNWMEAVPKQKRLLSSVFIPRKQKEEIVSHAEWFLDNKKWYQDRGMPYRLGYLFYGPPGTGKSSMVMALGSHLNKPIYVINPSALNNESCLQQAMSNVSGGAIVLIEDIDVSTKSFGMKAEEENTNKASRTIISMSCLLNAIDGVASSENRILIMTTNKVDQLDPVLIRPGRIDRKFQIGLMEAQEVEDMARAFFPDRLETAFEMTEKAISEPPKSGAEWQQEFMKVIDGKNLLNH